MDNTLPSGELEDWSDEQKSLVTEGLATAKYGALSEALRRSVTEARLCSMFCGGKNCKYEGTANWSEKQQAITGIYSNWITPDILAMARPNTEQIEKYDLIKQFKMNGIKSVFNLQISGEHASCGPGLESSGFTYHPQKFMDEGVFFYNYGWHDYSVGTMDGIADVVRVMQFALEQGKVAIHCHAGLGRTGVLIACYFVYSLRWDPDLSIHYIRKQRSASIQTRGQIRCIRDFADFLRPSRIIFSSVKPSYGEFTLSQFLHRQRFAVHGIESRYLKYLPKVIYICCNRLLQLASRLCDNEDHINRLFFTSRRLLSMSYSNGQLPSDDPQDVPYLPTSMSHTLATSLTPRLVNRNLEKLSVNVANRPTTALLRPVPVRPSISCDSLLPLSARTLGHLSMTHPLPLSASSTTLPEMQRLGSVNVVRAIDDINLPSINVGNKTAIPVSTKIVQAMASTEYAPEVLTKVDKYKLKLNMSAGEWHRLSSENDPLVLSALMWNWIDELKEPLLCIQDLPLLLDHYRQPLTALSFLQNGSHQTISYILHTVACLEPMSTTERESVIQRVASTLLHQNMILELHDVTASQDSFPRLLHRTSNDGIMRSEVAQRLMEFFTNYLRQYRVCECVGKRIQKALKMSATSGKPRVRTSLKVESVHSSQFT